MRWHRSPSKAVEAVRNEFILPDHVCRIPESERWGSTHFCPRDRDAQPVGTRWICECGRCWIVEPDLGLWERCKEDDVAELTES